MVAFLLKEGERMKISNLLKIKISEIHIKILTVLMWICKLFNYVYFTANFLAATETFKSIEPEKYHYTWIGINNVRDFHDNWKVLFYNLILIF